MSVKKQVEKLSTTPTHHDFDAIVSDFDGTLAGIDSIISQPVQRAIGQWIAAGKHFSIGTGRRYADIHPHVTELELTDPQIVRNGAEIVKAGTGEVLHSETIDENELRQLVEFLLEHKIPFFAEEGSRVYTADSEEYVFHSDGTTIAPLDDMPFDQVTKLLAITDEFDEDYITLLFDDGIGPKLPGTAMVRSYSPFGKAWNVTSQKGTKHLAVLRLAQMLKIKPARIVGIGDNHNDYPLLTACGYKVAMDNAPDELKEIADVVAPSYLDDGVAEVILGLLEGSR